MTSARTMNAENKMDHVEFGCYPDGSGQKVECWYDRSRTRVVLVCINGIYSQTNWQQSPDDNVGGFARVSTPLASRHTNDTSNDEQGDLPLSCS